MLYSVYYNNILMQPNLTQKGTTKYSFEIFFEQKSICRGSMDL